MISLVAKTTLAFILFRVNGISTDGSVFKIHVPPPAGRYLQRFDEGVVETSASAPHVVRIDTQTPFDMKYPVSQTEHGRFNWPLYAAGGRA